MRVLATESHVRRRILSQVRRVLPQMRGRTLSQITLPLRLGQLTLLERVPRSGTKFTRDGAPSDPEREERVKRSSKKRARWELLWAGRTIEIEGQ